MYKLKVLEIDAKDADKLNDFMFFNFNENLEHLKLYNVKRDNLNGIEYLKK